MKQGLTRRRVAEWATIAAEDRFSAAVVSGVLYLVSGVSLAVVAGLPAVAHGHRLTLTVLALLTVVSSGIAFVVVRRDRTPVWALHSNQALALAMVGIVVGLSGGASSPLWFYIFFIALFAAYFYGRPVAITYLVLCAVVQALPLLYDDGATHQIFLAELICGAPSFLTLGLAISTGKRRAGSLRDRAETRAAEQSALRRVASAVADGESPETIFTMVAREAAALLGGSAAAVMRLDEESGRIIIVGRSAADPAASLPVGYVLPARPGSGTTEALRDGRPHRAGRPLPGGLAESLGYQSTLVAPVWVGERLWGTIAVVSETPDRFVREDEDALVELSELLATSISSAEKRARLAEQALSDSLTGLANLRALRSRLDAELARGGRHGSVVSVAVIDIDHFKEINDAAGHETGDVMLQRVAAAFRGFARAEDTVARIGGDEFAWLMPDTRREQALVAVERARRLIGAAPADPYRMTISAGICDTDSTGDPQELLRLADTALYWGKEHGRNQVWVYDPAIVEDLSERQRAARLERAHALEGLRALVRTREAGDPARHGHSERVAARAVDLAVALGWPRERTLLLGEAAALHAIGGLTGAGLPGLDATAGGVTAGDITRLREGAEAGAGLLEGLLDEQQVVWIREMYGGGGETDGTRSGGAILTVADLYDLMTAVSPGLTEQALAALERLSDAPADRRVVDRRVVEALRALLAGGEIGQPDTLR